MSENGLCEYFKTPSHKRKQVPSCSSDSSSTSDRFPPEKKRLFHQLSDSFNEEENNSVDESVDVDSGSMADSITLVDIMKRLDSLATKDDIRQLRAELDKVATRMDKIESVWFELNNDMDKIKRENSMLKEQLKEQEEKLVRVQSEQNDLQQYDRRWNVRVYNVAEKAGETAADCTKTCCKIFTDLIGVPTSEDDLEVVHRTGPSGRGKPRPIIVRFQSRKLKDRVLKDRKNLKNKGVSVGEDLTPANYRLLQQAYKHSASLASWSSQGKIFAKLKNGKTVPITFGTNVDDLFRKEMRAGPN